MANEQESILIRAGVSCTIPYGGSVQCEIAGAFSRDDAEDAIELLNLVIRSVRRQIARGSILEPHPGDTGKGG